MSDQEAAPARNLPARNLPAKNSPANKFHEATKLGYINLANKPPLYKSYPDSPAIPLPTGFSLPQLSTLRAIAGDAESTAGSTADSTTETINLETVASLLYHSSGVIRKAIHPTAGEVHYRAAASAGALYPVETYLVCQDLPGLGAGVYHFSPPEFSLRQLRAGDYRQILIEAAGEEAGSIDGPANKSPVTQAPLTLIFTTIFWRSAWKYRARGYRYCYWDTGTVLANLLAAATASGLSARLIAGFADARVDQLLGIDGSREATACLVPLGSGAAPVPVAAAPDLASAPPEEHKDDEFIFPDSAELHAASRLDSRDAVISWRGNAPSQREIDPASSDSNPLNQGTTNQGTPPETPLEAAVLSQAILNRGSTRRFARESIPLAHFRALLEHATRGIPADFLEAETSSLVDIYAIVNSVEGLTSGSYFFSPRKNELNLLQAGDFREESGHLGFEQALPADASAVLFFMTNLEAVLARFGNRGYRVAQMEAGLLGGRMYLGVHSLGFGASGLTFYDDAVTQFFSPHAAGKSTLFVLPLGRKAAINRVRPFRSKVAARLDALARGAGQSAS